MVHDPLSLLCRRAVWHEDSSFDLTIGCRNNSPSMSEIPTSSACMLSWVMARRKSLSICMLPWIRAGLYARDWAFVRFLSSAMDWLGSPSWAMDSLGSLFWAWIGEVLSLRASTRAGPSLSRPDSGGTISLGGGTILPWDRTISPCVRCALIEPGIFLHVHSLCGPDLGEKFIVFSALCSCFSCCLLLL